MFDWYLRWRHGRGYGIHSPFAFSFLFSQLREQRGYAYYAYSRLPRSARYDRATLRLLYRVLVRLCPADICVAGGDDALRRVVRLACPRSAEATAHRAALTIVAGEDPGALRPDSHLIVLRPYNRAAMRSWQTRTAVPGGGMAFGGRHSRALIFVANPKLPRQNFDISF